MGLKSSALAHLDEEARQVPLSLHLPRVLRQQLPLLRCPLPEWPRRGIAGRALCLLFPLRHLAGGYFQQGGLLRLLRRGGAHPPPSTRTRPPLKDHLGRHPYAPPSTVGYSDKLLDEQLLGEPSTQCARSSRWVSPGIRSDTQPESLEGRGLTPRERPAGPYAGSLFHHPETGGEQPWRAAAAAKQSRSSARCPSNCRSRSVTCSRCRPRAGWTANTQPLRVAVIGERSRERTVSATS